MSTNWNEVSGDGGSSGVPEMVTDETGAYVAQNEDKVYEDPDWAWPQVTQLLEGGE